MAEETKAIREHTDYIAHEFAPKEILTAASMNSLSFEAGRNSKEVGELIEITDAINADIETLKSNLGEFETVGEQIAKIDGIQTTVTSGFKNFAGETVGVVDAVTDIQGKVGSDTLTKVDGKTDADMSTIIKELQNLATTGNSSFGIIGTENTGTSHTLRDDLLSVKNTFFAIRLKNNVTSYSDIPFTNKTSQFIALCFGGFGLGYTGVVMVLSFDAVDDLYIRAHSGGQLNGSSWAHIASTAAYTNAMNYVALQERVANLEKDVKALKEK